MQEFDKIGEDLFNKIRGRFPSITIGNDAGEVINEPSQARFFDFEYKESDKVLGNVSVNITEDEGMTIIFSKDFIAAEDSMTKDNWYAFLKELRLFAKKRMMEFSIRDITKSNLTKRDYKFLSNRTGDRTMAESKLYGTSKISYQDVDGARLMIKHTESVNQEQVSGRTRNVGAIYIESSEGERFKYPYKHLNGARAMARHVAEGGNAYDDFGKHIISLSEEQAKLSKFKRYMSRSAVMAESLAGYTDAVNERIVTVKKTLENLQKKAYYVETFESFAPVVMEDVPVDVAENWIDQLTIRQFNEELKDIFPYVFKLVSEVTKAKELGPDDLAEQQLDEVLPALAIPALMTAARLAAPKLAQMGARILSKGAQGAGAVAKGAGGVAIRNPGTTAAIGGGAYVGKKASDAIDAVGDMAGGLATSAGDILAKAEGGIEAIQGEISAFLGGGAVKQVAAMAAKYALPGLAVVAILYGGKKVIDMLRSKDDNMQTASIESIEEAIKLAEQDCWDGYKKDGTQKGTGKNKGKRVNKCVPEDAQLEQGFEEMMGQFGEGQFKRDMTDDAQDMDKEEFMNKYSDYGEEEASAMWDDMNEGDDDTMDVKIDKDGSISKDDGHEEKEQKTPLGEFILSYFDRENGAFPKGETAVLTMVEKDYGEQYINPAKQFIEQIQAKFDEHQMRTQPQQMEAEIGSWENDIDRDDTEALLAYAQKVLPPEILKTKWRDGSADTLINLLMRAGKIDADEFDDSGAISPTEKNEDAVDENFTQAAAAAARAHQSEFEYPKGSGKMHPVKMSKGTAHEINDDLDEMQPKDPKSVEVRVGNDINDILNGALDGQDMSDQIDALSQKWLGGNEIEDDSGMHDAIRLVVYTHKKEPADQAEAAEEALSMIDNPTEAQNIDRIRELAGLR